MGVKDEMRLGSRKEGEMRKESGKCSKMRIGRDKRIEMGVGEW